MLWMLNKLRGTSASWKLDWKSQLSSVARGDAQSFSAFWMCLCVESIERTETLSPVLWIECRATDKLRGQVFGFWCAVSFQNDKFMQENEKCWTIWMMRRHCNAATNDCSNSSFQDQTFLYKCSLCLFRCMWALIHFKSSIHRMMRKYTVRLSVTAFFRSFHVWSFNSTCQTNIKSHFCRGNAAINTANVDMHAHFLNPPIHIAP